MTPRETMDLISPGTGLTFTHVSDFIILAGGNFVVGLWLGAMSLGFFTRADRLASLPFEYIRNILFEVMFPAMTQRQQRVDRLRTVYLHSTEILSLTVLPASALMLVGAPEIVAVVLGKQWGETVSVLQILIIAIPFQAHCVVNAATIRASGAAYREAWRQGAHALLVVSGAWLGSRWGLNGVAVAIVGTWIIAYLLTVQLAVSLLGLRPKHLLRSWLPGLWTLAWTAPALWLTANLARFWALTAALTLFLDILVCAVAVVVAAYCAPPCVRLRSVPWLLAQAPFEPLGTLGYYLRKGLVRLSTVHDPDLYGGPSPDHLDTSGIVEARPVTRLAPRALTPKRSRNPQENRNDGGST